MTAAVRIVLVVWVLATVARAGWGAWRQRTLVRTVWRMIGRRELLVASVLVVLVASLALTLVSVVPGLARGLGDLVGTTGNVVLTPVEQAAQAAAEDPEPGPRVWLAVGATLFLGALAALLPWLAFLEEELFRAGLERAGPGRQVAVALLFGAAHLVMLVPLGAALAIAGAGFVYGRAYRAAYARPGGAGLPPAAVEVANRAFRPTRRARAATAALVRAETPAAPAAPVGPGSRAVARGEGSVVEELRRRQAGAVLATAALHTAFNTIVLILVWLGVVIGALTGSL